MEKYSKHQSRWLTAIEEALSKQSRPFRIRGARHSEFYRSYPENSVFDITAYNEWLEPPIIEREYLYCSGAHTLRECQDACRKAGRMLRGLPEVDSITVGGAIVVDAHGGGSDAPFSHYVNDIQRTLDGVILLVKLSTFPLQNIRVDYEWRENVEEEALENPNLHSIHFLVWGHIFEYRTLTNETYTPFRNGILDFYSGISTNEYLLYLVGMLLRYNSSMARVLQSVAVIPLGHVKSDPFSIVPSSEAYTMEFLIPWSARADALQAMRYMIDNYPISYRAWVRTLKMASDRRIPMASDHRIPMASDHRMLCFEITVERQQTDAHEIMRQFYARFSPMGIPHRGKTQYADFSS